MPGAFIPIMRDPLKLLDYDHWWKKDLGNILPYSIPAVKEDVTSKMEVQLEDSSNRILNTRANAHSILQHLQSLIDAGKIAHSFPFTWNLKMYKSPPKKSVTKFEFTTEQMALIENVALDNAVKRCMNLDPCLIHQHISKIETAHFCIVKCPKDLSTPFYVAEVCSNNSSTNTLTVQWWAPNAICKHKGGQYHTLGFEAQTNKQRISNRQKGAPQWRLHPHLDDIAYSSVYFGFSRMTRDRRLPAEVLRKLKGLSLISKTIRIKSL